jgi:two-component system, NarL family, nitrate/nitrite response regulator NarL
MRLRYLIVDDSASFLAASRRLLERQGLMVVGVASTVRECLRRVTELVPDVILLDVDLGEESGFEVARRLARHGVGSDVIFMSMHPVDDYADLIATSGALGFLTKSELSRETIEELVRNAGWEGDGTSG